MGLVVKSKTGGRGESGGGVEKEDGGGEEKKKDGGGVEKEDGSGGVEKGRGGMNLVNYNRPPQLNK